MLSKTYTKYIQSLHLKKFRDIENVFIAEGSKVVMDLLGSSKIVCRQILGVEEWVKENEPAIRRYFNGTPGIIETYELEKISALNTPSRVLAIFDKKQPAIVDPAQQLTIALDTIQDPGNLGTIIRIADWFGVPSIICSENCADIYNPKVVQSSMGSIGRVEVLYTNLAEWLKNNRGPAVYAAALVGKNINELGGLKEGIIVIGNESKGISSEIMNLATLKITIPKTGDAESLNAAVATGIILSHLTSPPGHNEVGGA